MSPQADAAAPPVVPREPLLRRIAERLPEIVIEALFMLAAVVLAFAVEEWREERELDRFADEARAAVVQEVVNNRDELLESRAGLAASLAALDAAVALPPTEAAAHLAKVELELSVMSTAAWRAAQSTEASRRMDYAWLLKASQVYDLQSMYQQAQWAAVDTEVAMNAAADPVVRLEHARVLRSRLKLLAALGDALEEDYWAQHG